MRTYKSPVSPTPDVISPTNDMALTPEFISSLPKEIDVEPTSIFYQKSQNKDLTYFAHHLVADGKKFTPVYPVGQLEKRVIEEATPVSIFESQETECEDYWERTFLTHGPLSGVRNNTPVTILRCVQRIVQVRNKTTATVYLITDDYVLSEVPINVEFTFVSKMI
jgi:hypothetical protein